MKPIFFTDESFSDFQIGPAKTDKSMYDVLIKILAEGWTPFSISSIKYNNNYIIVKTTELTQLKKGQRVFLKSDELTGEFIIVDSINNVVILYSADVNKPDSDEISIQGTVELLSAGWTQEYRDEDNVVLKPKSADRSDRLLLRQHAFEKGIYVMDKDELTSPCQLYTNSTNLAMQPIALFNFEPHLSIKDNIIKNSIKSVENHDHLPSHTTGSNATTLSMWMNKITPQVNINKWWVYATDELVMYGFWCWFNIFKMSSIGIYGIVENTYGTKSTILTGLSTKNTQTNSNSYGITTGYYEPFFSGGWFVDGIDAFVTRVTIPENNKLCTVYNRCDDMYGYAANTQNVYTSETQYCPYMVKDLIMNIHNKTSTACYPFVKMPIQGLYGNLPPPSISQNNCHNIIEIDGELYYVLIFGRAVAFGNSFASLLFTKGCIKL